MMYIEGTDVLGAGAGLPSWRELEPYFLTELPPDGEPLAQVYAGYLRALDGLISSTRSITHLVNSSAAVTALYGARGAIEEAWKRGTPYDRVVAVQLLAGTVGYFNAKYRRQDGTVDWDAFDAPVNAAVFEGVSDVARSAMDAASGAGESVKKFVKGAGEAAETAWWTLVIGGAVVVVGVGALIWKAMDSGTAKAAAQMVVPYPLRRY